jgi:hypothetical protein
VGVDVPSPHKKVAGMGHKGSVLLGGGNHTSGISSAESVGQTLAWAIRNISGVSFLIGSTRAALTLGSNQACTVKSSGEIEYPDPSTRGTSNDPKYTWTDEIRYASSLISYRTLFSSVATVTVPMMWLVAAVVLQSIAPIQRSHAMLPPAQAIRLLHPHCTVALKNGRVLLVKQSGTKGLHDAKAL